MAFRLALSVLFVAAIIGASTANPTVRYRVVRAAEPAGVPKPQQQVAPKSAFPAQYTFQPQFQPQVQAYKPIPSPVVPAPAPVPKSGNFVADQQASIIQQNYDFNPADNSYSQSFQTDNGISQQSKGYINQAGNYVVEGSYTLYTKEGYPVSISYVADENGYNAVGESIPQADPQIIKAVEYLRSLPPQKDEQQ